MNPTDWASKKAEQVRKARQQQELQRQAFVDETQIKKAHAPGQWDQIKKGLKHRVELFNQELGSIAGLEWHEVSSREIIIGIVGTTKKSHVSFKPETLRIESVLLPPSASVMRNLEYNATVVNGNAAFCDSNGNLQMQEELLEQILDQIVQVMMSA